MATYRSGALFVAPPNERKELDGVNMVLRTDLHFADAARLDSVVPNVSPNKPIAEIVMRRAAAAEDMAIRKINA